MEGAFNSSDDYGDFLSNLANFQKCGFLCDVTLTSTDGTCMLAHAVVLAAASPQMAIEFIPCTGGNYVIDTALNTHQLEEFVRCSYSSRRVTRIHIPENKAAMEDRNTITSEHHVSLPADTELKASENPISKIENTVSGCRTGMDEADRRKGRAFVKSKVRPSDDKMAKKNQDRYRKGGQLKTRENCNSLSQEVRECQIHETLNLIGDDLFMECDDISITHENLMRETPKVVKNPKRYKDGNCYQCRYCFRGFRHMHSLKRHVSIRHSHSDRNSFTLPSGYITPRLQQKEKCLLTASELGIDVSWLTVTVDLTRFDKDHGDVRSCEDIEFGKEHKETGSVYSAPVANSVPCGVTQKCTVRLIPCDKT